MRPKFTNKKKEDKYKKTSKYSHLKSAGPLPSGLYLESGSTLLRRRGLSLEGLQRSGQRLGFSPRTQTLDQNVAVHLFGDLWSTALPPPPAPQPQSLLTDSQLHTHTLEHAPREHPKHGHIRKSEIREIVKLT